MRRIFPRPLIEVRTISNRMDGLQEQMRVLAPRVSSLEKSTALVTAWRSEIDVGGIGLQLGLTIISERSSFSGMRPFGFSTAGHPMKMISSGPSARLLTFLLMQRLFRHPRLGQDTPCRDIPGELIGHADRLANWLRQPGHSELTSDVALSSTKEVILGEVSRNVTGRDRRVIAMQEAIQQGKGCFGAVHFLSENQLSLKYALLLTFNESNYEDFDGAKHEGDGNTLRTSY